MAGENEAAVVQLTATKQRSAFALAIDRLPGRESCCVTLLVAQVLGLQSRGKSLRSLLYWCRCSCTKRKRRSEQLLSPHIDSLA